MSLSVPLAQASRTRHLWTTRRTVQRASARADSVRTPLSAHREHTRRSVERFTKGACKLRLTSLRRLSGEGALMRANVRPGQPRYLLDSLIRCAGLQSRTELRFGLPLNQPGWVTCSRLLADPTAFDHWRKTLARWL